MLKIITTKIQKKFQNSLEKGYNWFIMDHVGLKNKFEKEIQDFQKFEQ